jgi:hypothetical protein
MEVFVLMGSIRYHWKGDMLLGVYASEEEAWDAHGVYIRDDANRDFDNFFVACKVIGAPAVPSWYLEL